MNSQTAYVRPAMAQPVPPQQVTGTSYVNTKSTAGPSYAKPFEWALIILVMILVIAFIVWVIWHFGFQKVGKPPGDTCSANSDCETGTYCSANGVCTIGEGGKEGDVCEISTQCIMGLLCDQGTHRCTRSLGPL